jgi:hypothetical protein
MISHIYEQRLRDKYLALAAHLLPRYFYTSECLCFRTPKREMTSSTLSMRMDRTIIEGLHDIVSVLEDHLKPLVQVGSGSGSATFGRIFHTIIHTYFTFTRKQCCGSLTIWYGPRSADPCLLPMDPDPNPANLLHTLFIDKSQS